MFGAAASMGAFIAAALFLLSGSSPPEEDGVVHEVRRSGVVEVGLPSAAPRGGSPEAHGPNVNTTVNSRAQAETTIALDPNNPLNLVGGTADYRNGDSDAGVAYSLDGGATWSANTLAGLNPALGKYDAQGDPAVAAYRNGVFYYASIDFDRNSDQNRLPVAKSFDGGITWPQLGVIIDHAGGGSHDFEDKVYIAVDNTHGPHDGNVYVSWTRFPVVGSSRIMFSRSTNGGVSFSAPTQISDSTLSYQGSVPAVGPAGELYVAWQHGNRIEIDKSTDGGASWGSDRLVSTIDSIPSPLPGSLYRVNSFPTVAVDRTTCNVLVAWADDRGPDIWFSRSTNGGASFNAPIVVSDDVNGSYQFFPWLSVEPGGAINIVFFDRRTDPNSFFYHTFAARSTDGGLSFGANEQISNEISDSRNDGFGGTFIGDYNGLASGPGRAHPLWTDCRASIGNAEAFTVSLGFCFGDLDGSGAVDFGDILAILAAWGNAGGPEDLDGNGVVDFGDILLVLGGWGPCLEHLGACYLEDGTCQDGTVESDCTDMGGSYGGDGTTCVSCFVAADDCADASTVSDGVYSYSTLGATTDGPTLPEKCDEGNGVRCRKDVWIRYVASCAGTATASVCDSDFDTRIVVYEDDDCPGPFLACNDDACGEGGTRSEVSFPVQSGGRYLIRIGSPRFETGEGTLVIDCAD